MTREEIENISIVHPYCFETDREKDWHKIGCTDGLKAADAEPNLESLWHDASEIPKENTWVLAEFNEISYETFFMCPLGEAWCKDVNLTRWAYISDLLPKGGKQ